MHPDYQEARKMRDEGATLMEIARRFGMSKDSVYNIIGVPDPGPSVEFLTMNGETPEQRAFRRFPINSHKPAR